MFEIEGLDFSLYTFCIFKNAVRKQCPLRVAFPLPHKVERRLACLRAQCVSLLFHGYLIMQWFINLARITKMKSTLRISYTKDRI